MKWQWAILVLLVTSGAVKKKEPEKDTLNMFTEGARAAVANRTTEAACDASIEPAQPVEPTSPAPTVPPVCISGGPPAPIIRPSDGKSLEYYNSINGGDHPNREECLSDDSADGTDETRPDTNPDTNLDPPLVIQKKVVTNFEGLIAGIADSQAMMIQMLQQMICDSDRSGWTPP